MRPDLQALEITQADLSSLSGIDLDQQEIKSPKNSIFEKTVLFFVPLFFAAYIILSPLLKSLDLDEDGLPLLVSFLMAIVIALSAAKATASQSSKNQKNKNQDELISLMSLKTDVENFNKLIKAIDIKDQLEEAGNTGMNLKEREKVVAALQLARQDLVRALKTEKILRENQDLMMNNPELFTNNLSGLTALQVNEQATELSQILSSTLQVAVDVQEEMINLQKRHSLQ